MGHAAGRHRIQNQGAASARQFDAQRLVKSSARVRDEVIWKIFESSSFAQSNHGFEDRGLFRGAIDSRRRRRSQANVSARFQRNFRDEMIASQNSSRRIKEHQVRSAISERKRSQRLKRQREARLGEDGALAAPRKSQSQKSVTPDALGNSLSIQRAGSGESIR